MRNIFLFLIICLLLSGNAFAAKRVCIFVHKNYMEVKEPVLLAKRRMIVDLAGCEKGNGAIQNTQDYKIYHFKKNINSHASVLFNHNFFEKYFFKIN